jgi:hypothetical protein
MKMEEIMKDEMRILVCGGGEEGTTFAKDILQFYGDRVS